MPPQDPGAAAPTPAAPGNANALATSGPFAIAKILDLTWTDDHRLLLDNDKDWSSAGVRFPEPPFTYGKPGSPTSRSFAGTLRLTVTLEMWPYEAPTTACALAGTCFGLSFATNVYLKGGKQPVVLESSTAVDSAVKAMAGDLELSITPDGGALLQADHAWRLLVYSTVGTPTDRPNREAGFTSKHMECAVRRVSAAGTGLDEHAVVLGLMGLIKAYTLQPNAVVQQADPGAAHPTYFNDFGGAWRIDSWVQYMAECQAICRWVVAMCRMVGLTNSKVVVCWADPREGANGPAHEGEVDGPGSGGLNGVTRQVNGETQAAALTDGWVVAGASYGVDQACLVCSANSDKRYYGGGVGGAYYASAEHVLLAFFCLVWVAPDPAAPPGVTKWIIREVVRTFRNAAGNVVPFRTPDGRTIP